MTFLIAETKYSTLEVKGGEVCLAHSSMIKFTVGWLQRRVTQQKGAEEKSPCRKAEGSKRVNSEGQTTALRPSSVSHIQGTHP